MTLSEAQRLRLEPLVETCCSKGKMQPMNLRRTLGAIVWWHRNGTAWRAYRRSSGPGETAAWLFVR